MTLLAQNTSIDTQRAHAVWCLPSKNRLECFVTVIKSLQGGSPGLVVMGRDSHSKGRGFDSRCHILDGHFSHLFVLKIVKFVRKDQK